MKIIQRKHQVEVVVYERSFMDLSDPTRGFSFRCLQNGVIMTEDLNPLSRANLGKCLDGTFSVVDMGVEKVLVQYLEPAIGRCECGDKVDLTHYVNPCSCGKEYGYDGLELSPPWGWDDMTTDDKTVVD
jgi:hypothetical protein